MDQFKLLALEVLAASKPDLLKVLHKLTVTLLKALCKEMLLTEGC